MQTFNYSGFDVRLWDMRPRNQSIQVNIYNPEDAGHSYCAFVQFGEEDAEKTLQEFFDSMTANGFIDMLIPKAQAAFATPSPEATN